MEKHSDALRVLRWANNNREVGKLFEEWWRTECSELKKVFGRGLDEKSDAEKTEAEIRCKRLSAELERLEGGSKDSGARRSLAVEFSIENAQVVKTS